MFYSYNRYLKEAVGCLFSQNESLIEAEYILIFC